MNILRPCLFLFALFLVCTGAYAQLTQTLRGTVLDKDLQVPLAGATVTLTGSGNVISAITDAGGNFRLEHVPVGRREITVKYLGYKPLVVSDIVVNSGKEAVLQLYLEEDIITGQEIIVEGNDQEKPNNELAVVSTTTLRTEAINRFAGSRQDPARVASNYAGVSGGGDLRNDIIVRGNTPMGVLWRLEGIEIPNPNHFAVTGTTGGAFSILNNNLLANTDFLTGAFPAEYGNKTAAAFDVRMRNGNNQKREHTIQIGLNGLEFTTEGPLTKQKGSSYLVSGRLLSFKALSALGVSIGVNGIPQFQDLSFKLNLPLSEKNVLSVWGIGGTSSIVTKESETDTGDWDGNSVTDNDFSGDMYATGITLTSLYSPRTSAKLTLSANSSGSHVYNQDYFKNMSHRMDEDYSSRENQYLVQYVITTKLNVRNLWKSGITARSISNTVYQKYYEDSTYLTGLDQKNTSSLLQAFTQWQYKPSARFDIVTGLYTQLFTFNNKAVIEPRIGMQYRINEKQKLSFGAGMHSQTLPLIYYMYQYFNEATNSYEQPNRDLGFLKSIHYVAGYQLLIGKNLRFKTEAYYQHLYEVPVSLEAGNGYYSIMNVGADFSFETADSMVNTGKGRNYGIEFTLERSFSKGYYVLATASLFDSKFTGSDGIWRNTAFNLGHVFNLLAGKEFKLDAENRRTLSVDIKVNHTGGRRIIPIDVAQSIFYGEEQLDVKRAYEEKVKDFFRFDLKVTMNINRAKATHQFFVAADNLFNTQNELMREWDSAKQRTEIVYQMGVFPYLGYRVNF